MTSKFLDHTYSIQWHSFTCMLYYTPISYYYYIICFILNVIYVIYRQCKICIAKMHAVHVYISIYQMTVYNMTS